MRLIHQRRRLAVAVVFGVLGLVIGSAAIQSRSIIIALLASWLAANAIALSIAYFANWPGVFGKSNDGTLHLAPALFMAPALLAIQIVWRLQNLILRSPRFHEITPDLFVGRICEDHLLTEEIDLVIDLTAEFPTPRSFRTRRELICLPTLDGCCPNWMRLRQYFETIDDKPRRIYVCCANGTGRSVTAAAAWLGYSGDCRSADEAVAVIRASRREAAPNRDQMRFLGEVFESFGEK